MPKAGDLFASPDFPEALRKIRERTPARILVGRAGAAYRTATQLDLREAHATARDAVRAELNLEAALGTDFVKHWQLFEVFTEAASKDEYLLLPDRGRHFSETSRREILAHCSRGNDIQFAIGDGLSVSAIAAQVPWRKCLKGSWWKILNVCSASRAVATSQRPGLCFSRYRRYESVKPETRKNEKEYHVARRP